LPPSDHFDGQRFFIPDHETDRGFRDILPWKLKESRARMAAVDPCGRPFRMPASPDYMRRSSATRAP